MVVDAILYNGESELFDLRYNILKDVVDEFVVVEFDTTFSGRAKKRNPIDLPKVSYYFRTQWTHHNEANGLPEAFGIEYNQREAIKDCLTHLKDDDALFMGDCDEIWNPFAVNAALIWITKLRLLVYSYWLNNRSSEDFALGPVMGTWGMMKNRSFNDLRTSTTLTSSYHGWHFTSMGGVEALKRKIESYGHQEFNTKEIKDNLELALSTGKDFIGRDFRYTIDESDWPQYLKDNREKYVHLCRERQKETLNT